MALTGNPTRTRVIERNWFREIRRRWRAFSRSVLPRLDAMNGQALVLNQAGDPFVLSAEQQRIYMAFLEAEINRLLLETDQAPNWQGQYQLESYMRGLEQVQGRLRAQGVEAGPTPEERAAAEALQPFTARPSLATTPSTLQPVHREGLEFLWQRSYTTLKGWTDAMARETRQILFDALETGQGIREVTRAIGERIGVNRRHAETIARTETNQAYSRASVAEVDRLNDETDADVRVRWITAIVKTRKGNPVRPNHARLHGKVMTTAQAAAVKRSDGVNCRCALAPVVPGTNTPKKQAAFDQQRAQTLAITRSAA